VLHEHPEWGIFCAEAEIGDAQAFLAYCVKKYYEEGGAPNDYFLECASDSVKYAARALFHLVTGPYDRKVEAWDWIIGNTPATHVEGPVVGPDPRD